MYQTNLFIIESESQEVIPRAIQALTEAGMQVVQSFDFRDAHAVHIDCPCPYHGTAQCDCQMVVLLVYEQDNPPLTLVVHGHDGQTQFAVVVSPAQQPDPHFVEDVLLKLRTMFNSGEHFKESAEHRKEIPSQVK